LKANGEDEEPLINDCQRHGGPHVKVFNVGASVEGKVQSEQIDVNLVHPPGFEPHLSPSIENSGETSIPLGFEETIKAKVSLVRKGSTIKRHIDSIGKRVTRSQT